MHCLNCNKVMTNYVIHTPLHQLSYDICDSCGSFWLDKGEFNKIVDQGSGDVEYCSQDVVAHDTKMCPRCDNMALDKVKFRKVVVPGDQLRLEVEVLKMKSKIGICRGIATVNGEVACEAEFMFSLMPPIEMA